MPSSKDWTSPPTAGLGGSNLEDWSSFLESSPGPETSQTSAASRPARVSRLSFIALSLHLAPGLVLISIFWLLLLLGAVFVSIRLISWATAERGLSPSLEAVLPSESDWDEWTDKRRSFCPDLLCGDWNKLWDDDPLLWKYGPLPKDCHSCGLEPTREFKA
jgi:hypothetical protein